MKTQEVLDKTAIAISLLEWEHDISIAAALDVAMKRVKDWERLKKMVEEYRDTKATAWDRNAICFILGRMAEMENEDGN